MNRSLMTMKALRKHVAGFSLIEVMVVLVIIGIMAAIGMPAYQRYTYAARQSEAHTMLRDILTAEQTELLKTGAFKIMAAMPTAARRRIVVGVISCSLLQVTATCRIQSTSSPTAQRASSVGQEVPRGRRRQLPRPTASSR